MTIRLSGQVVQSAFSFTKLSFRGDFTMHSFIKRCSGAVVVFRGGMARALRICFLAAAALLGSAGAAAGAHFEVVHPFNPFPNGAYLYAGVLQASDGDLYGTTILGGSGDAGTVYRLGISPRFVRGDVNGNGSVELADSVLELEYLFSHRVQLGCLDAADVNDDGKLGLADPIHILKALFSGHFSIPGPYPGCGPDPTHDLLGCESYTGCQ